MKLPLTMLVADGLCSNGFLTSEIVPVAPQSLHTQSIEPFFEQVEASYFTVSLFLWRQGNLGSTYGEGVSGSGTSGAGVDVGSGTSGAGVGVGSTASGSGSVPSAKAAGIPRENTRASIRQRHKTLVNFRILFPSKDFFTCSSHFIREAGPILRLKNSSCHCSRIPPRSIVSILYYMHRATASPFLKNFSDLNSRFL